MIKELIKNSGKSMKQVAEDSNISRQYLYLLINGKIKNPSYNKLKKLAITLNITLDKIYKE